MREHVKQTSLAGFGLPARCPDESARDFVDRLDRAAQELLPPLSGASALRSLFLAISFGWHAEVAHKLAALPGIAGADGQCVVDVLLIHRATGPEWSVPPALPALRAALTQLAEPLFKLELVLALGIWMVRHVGTSATLSLFDDTLDLVLEHGDVVQRGRYFNNLAVALLVVDRFADALVAARQATAIRRAAGLVHGVPSSLINKAVALRHLGDYPSALSCLREAISIEEGLCQSQRLSLIYQNMARLQLAMGDLAGARESLRVAEISVGSQQVAQDASHLKLVQALVDIHSGELDRGFVTLTNVAMHGSAVVDREATSLLMELLTRHGRFAAARELLATEQARPPAEHTNDDVYVALARSRLAHHHGDHEGALAYQTSATAIAARLGSVEAIDTAARAAIHQAESIGDLRTAVRLTREHHARMHQRRSAVLTTQLMAARVEQETWAATVRAREAEATRDALDRAHQRLRDEIEARRQALGDIVQNLRVPLTATIATAQILGQRLVAHERQDLLEFPEVLVAAAERMAERIDAMLLEETLEARQPEWSQRPVDVTRLARDVAEGLGGPARRKLQRIVVNGGMTLAHTDRAMLIEVLENLVGNAIKFSPEQGMVQVDVFAREESVHIVVHDEGPGFSAADLPRAFRRFGKLSAKPTAGESSTGLGLFSVKQLVHKLAGQVAITSEPAAGACIEVQLPLRPPTG